MVHNLLCELAPALFFQVSSPPLPHLTCHVSILLSFPWTHQTLACFMVFAHAVPSTCNTPPYLGLAPSNPPYTSGYFSDPQPKMDLPIILL